MRKRVLTLFKHTPSCMFKIYGCNYISMVAVQAKIANLVFLPF